MMKKHILSKSTFIKGIQCEKALYLNKHRKNLRDEITASQQAIFNQGTNVGELACQLFPGGVDCSPENFYDVQASVIKTKEAIDNGAEIIYEAAFQYDGVYSALDILVKENGAWKAFEVKSSTKVNETYELDAAIQYYCITNSGISLEDISIVYINNQYEKNGDIDIKELFAIESVHERVLELVPKLPFQIKQLKNVLDSDEIPKMDIGMHCSDPYDCNFMGHCWKHIPEYSAFNIARLRADKKFDLYERDAIKFNDIPDSYPLNDKQWMQVKCELNNESFIDKEAIQKFVGELNYPIYHLDFETFTSAVPVFDGSRPYQQLVFQYSLHVEHKDGRLEHKEYLAEVNGKDPRVKFIDQLINDCEEVGDVLVYNIGFERGKLFDLIDFSPNHKIPILKIINRLKDLMIPFRDRAYYTPAMQGSYSIKKVLPALVPELSYKDLNIQEGGTASITFSQMVQGNFDGDIEQTRKDLLAYCELDTLAMVEILRVLKLVF